MERTIARMFTVTLPMRRHTDTPDLDTIARIGLQHGLGAVAADRSPRTLGLRGTGAQVSHVFRSARAGERNRSSSVTPVQPETLSVSKHLGAQPQERSCHH